MSYLLDALGDAQSAGDMIDSTRDNVDEARRPIPAKEAKREGAKSPGNRLSPPKDRPMSEERNISGYYNSGGARHPRQQANKLFPSRDFH